MQPGIVSDRIASAGPLSQILPVRQHTTGPMRNNPEGIETFRVLLCSAVRCFGIFGAVFDSVPVFGLFPFRCLAICGCSSGRSPCRRSSPVSFGAVFGPSVCSPAPAHRVGIVCASSPLSASYTIHATARLRSSGYPALPPDNVRLLYVTAVLQTARQARQFLGPVANLPSVAGVGICSALLVCGLLSPLSRVIRQREMEGERTEETGNATGKCKGKPSVPRRPGAIYVWCSAQKIRIRHKKSGFGNGKSSFGNGKTQWEIKNPPPQTDGPKDSTTKAPVYILGKSKIR